jgi:hypothetical protein
MKYVMLIVDEAGYWETLPEDKRAEAFDRIGQWWGELSQKGTIVGGHQLQPANTATTVKVHGGKAEVSDGPIFVSDGRFKEALGGYGILDVANLDEAIAVVKSWPGDARLELRAIVESASMENLPTAQPAARASR